jgi:hypothetical protein
MTIIFKKMQMYRLQKYLLIIVSLFFISTSSFSQKNNIETINESILKMDHSVLHDYFNQTISVRLLKSHGKYSKVQARYILSDFFKKHPVKSLEILKSGAFESNQNYCILLYKTSTKNYKFYYRFKDKGDEIFIKEIQIREVVKYDN